MGLSDVLGHRVSGATPANLEAYEQAARELLCLVDDAVASVERALAASPDMTMAHVLKAWLNLLGTESASRPMRASSATSQRPRPGPPGAGAKRPFAWRI
jgi:hypothetical protein